MTNLAALCNHIRFLNGWWFQYEPAVSLFNKRIATCVRDHFVDGSFVADILERKHNLQIASAEYAKNYPFHEDYHYQNRYYLTQNKKGN